MKTCDEMVNSLLERRAQYVSAQKKKKKVIARTTVSVSSVALVSLAGFALFKNDAFHEKPPITDSVTTTTTVTTTTEIGDTTTVTTQTTTQTNPSVTRPTTRRPTTQTTASATATTTTEPSQTNPIKPTTSQTKPTTTQTQPTTTQTTVTTRPTTTQPSNEDPVDPLPEWPYLWIIYDMNANYANGEVPIYFKLEGFEEVPFDWVKETSYIADGFSVVGDITVERDAETGALIYRMVLAYDGVTPKPSFFFSVITADGMKQTDGLYGYPAPHGFFVSPSYDSAFSSSVYYLVKTGVITHDEYQAIMEKYWSESVNGSMSWC